MTVQEFSLLVLLCLACLFCSGTPHGGHHDPSILNAQQSILHNDRVVRDQEHIKEHLGDLGDEFDNMTQEEIEFHYFQLHDLNNDTKLDGLEILAALQHTFPETKDEFEKALHDELEWQKNIEAIDKQKAEAILGAYGQGDVITFYAHLIDRTLLEDDLDQDGYLSYIEYVLAHRRMQYEFDTGKKAEL